MASVPSVELFTWKVVAPPLSVEPLPVWPALGPLTTWKLTRTPLTAFPAASVTVAWTVAVAPTVMLWLSGLSTITLGLGPPPSALTGRTGSTPDRATPISAVNAIRTGILQPTAVPSVYAQFASLHDCQDVQGRTEYSGDARVYGPPPKRSAMASIWRA